MELVLFNWPAAVGGAGTKVEHLLPLLAAEWSVTVVPNDACQLEEVKWRRYVEGLGARCCLLEELPERMEGWALCLCNHAFLDRGILGAARRRGLRIAWSNEMMWHFPVERGAIAIGLVDAVLYTSPAQRAALEPGYLSIVGGQVPAGGVVTARGEVAGELQRGDGGPPVRWVITGNYIDPAKFPFRGPRSAEGPPFTIGRLSRPDPLKFPDDFPATYEALGLRDPVRFRVMGWDERVAAAWPGRVYDNRWELLAPLAEDTVRFLQSLDVMVYDLGPRFQESWGRAVVEAMLCGVVPLVPRGGGHHLENLVPHGVGGFLCDGPEDFGRYARMLQDDPALLARLSHGAREWAEQRLCNREEHRALWRMVFQD